MTSSGASVIATLVQPKVKTFAEYSEEERATPEDYEKDTELVIEKVFQHGYLDRFDAGRLGEQILDLSRRTQGLHRIITLKDTNEMFMYDGDVYVPNADKWVKEYCYGQLGKQNYRKSRVLEVIDYVQAGTYVERQEPPKNLLPVQNGLLDVLTGELKPFTPELMFFSKLAVKYDPNAKCPNIEKFLTEIVGSPDDIVLLQEVFGYCLLRDYPIAKALMLVGEGANGKSTFLNLVKTFLGADNVACVSLHELETNRFASARLYQRLANIYPDLPAKTLYETGKFKIATGNDSLGAENKFQQGFNFVNYAKFLFSANKVPEVTDESDAYFRRWLIVVFPNVFSEDKRDLKILEKLTTPEVLSGLLNFALEGLKRLLEKRDFSFSRSVEQIRQDYKRKASPVAAFFDDKIEVSTDEWVPKDELYNAFLRYCRENKLPPMDRVTFCRKVPMYAQGPIEDYRPSGNSRQRCFKGIRFKKQDPETQLIDSKEPLKAIF